MVSISILIIFLLKYLIKKIEKKINLKTGLLSNIYTIMSFSDLTITPSPSKFSSFRFCEAFDADKLKTLIDNDELITNINWGMESIAKKSIKTLLTEYLKKRNKRTKIPTVPVSYYYNEKYNYGRVYAEKSLSIGNMPRFIIHTTSCFFNNFFQYKEIKHTFQHNPFFILCENRHTA